MTPEQQRIAIAKACGFTDIMLPMGFHQQMSDEKSTQCGGKWRFEIPDYLNDLNACHEMEKMLTDRQWVQYEEEIRTVVLGGIRLVSQWTKADIHATAAQKSKAFLQTLGLWTATPTQPQ